MTPINDGDQNRLATSIRSRTPQLQRAEAKHKSITEHFLPAGNIQMQPGGSSWKPRQPFFPSEDRAQRTSGSQWAQPERLSAWRSEDNPLLPVTSSDSCLQLTVQCWKLCSPNSHIPAQICRCLFLCVRSGLVQPQRYWALMLVGIPAGLQQLST